MNYNKTIGEFGENLAINYLTKKGYKILDKNIKTSYYEFDILAYIEDVLVFVEVKTRTSKIMGSAEDSLNIKKIINLKKGIINYLSQKKVVHNSIRIDLVAIDINRQKKIANIKHFKDVI